MSANKCNKCGESMDIVLTCGCGNERYSNHILKGYMRYEKMRLMTPSQFEDIWEDNKRGVDTFDSLVDSWRRG